MTGHSLHAGRNFMGACRCLLTVVAALCVVAPLLAVLATALRGDGGTVDFVADIRLRQAIWNTVVMTITATSVGVMLGVPMAWAVGRTDIRWKVAWERLSMVPVVVPPLVGAVGWLVMLEPKVGLLSAVIGGLALPRPDVLSTATGIGAIVGLYQAPFIFTALRGAMTTVSSSYEEAARVFGSGPIVAFLRVTLPTVKRSLLSSTVSCLARSASNIGVPLILGPASGVNVISTLLFSAVVFEGDVVVGARLGLLFLLVTTALYYFQVKLAGSATVSALQVRHARRDPTRVRGAVRAFAYVVLVLYSLLAVFIPLCGVLYLSLIAFWSRSPLSAIVTAENYVHAFGDRLAHQAVLTTFSAAMPAAFLTVLLGSLLAFLVTRGGSRWDRGLEAVISVVRGVPPVVFGLGLLLVLVRLRFGLYGTMGAVVFAYVAYWLAFGVQTLTPFFHQVPRAYEEAAAIHGASTAERFGGVLLPILGKDLYLVATLLFLNMIIDLPVVIFLQAPGSITMPAKLYDFWSDGFPPVAAAFAVELVGIAFAAMLLLERLPGWAMRGAYVIDSIRRSAWRRPRPA
jgi:iron(III) transport system permease protein